MKHRHLIPLTCVVSWGCADEPNHYQSPNTCFVALPLICEQHSKTMPTRADDPLLGICLPFVSGTLKGWHAQGSSVTTIRYGADGFIEDIASECGQGETIHTTAERDADGRVVRWTVDLDELTWSDENEIDAEPAMIWKWYAERRATYDEDGLLTSEISGNPESNAAFSERMLTYQDGRVASLDYEEHAYTEVEGDVPASWYWADASTFDYNIDGSLAAIHTNGEEAFTPGGTTSFSYDGGGHLIERENVEAGHRATFEWDGERLLGSSVIALLAIPVFDVTYAYEGDRIVVAERIQPQHDLHQATEWWEYDEQGRPVRLAWWGRDLFGGPDAPFPEHR